MDTQLLRTFIEVSKTRHFRYAAENLFITQAAVSFRIKQLESSLGVELFVRQRGNLRLTQAGERLLPHARLILQSLGRAFQDVALTDSYQELLTIGGSAAIWELDALSKLFDLAYKHIEHIALRIESMPKSALIKQLLEQRIDIGFSYASIGEATLKRKKIKDDQLILVTNKPNIALSNIKTQSFILLDWGFGLKIEYGKIYELQRTPKLHTSSCKLALEHLLSNGGVAFLPALLVNDYLHRKELYRVEEIDPIAQTLYMLWSENSKKIHLIEQFTNLINLT